MKRLVLILSLLTASAWAQNLLPQGGIAVSCNAVTASTSANPGAAGGCTAFALVTSGGVLPGVYTWQVITTGSPASVTVTLQGSLDGVTWTQLDTTSAAGSRTTSSVTAYRFLGCIPSTLTGGSSPTVTCQISVTSSGGGGGSGTVSSGTTGQLAKYTGSTTVGNSSVTDNGTGGSSDIIVSDTNFQVNNTTGLLDVINVTSGANVRFNSAHNASISAISAGVFNFGNGTNTDNTAKLQAAGYISKGTTFTSNAGCGDTTLVGGATAGKYTSVTAGTCTTVITMGNSATAPNGWSCTATDLTTAADAGNIKQTATSQTTASLNETTVAASDVIQFSCVGY